MGYLKGHLRNPDIIKKHIKITGNEAFTTDEIHLIFPKVYQDKHLAFIGDGVSVLGIVMLKVNNTYAVMNVNAIINFALPSQIDSFVEDNDDYFDITYAKGSKILNSIDVIKQDTIPYQVYDLFISAGNIPFYMSYLDVCGLFSTASKYADANVGERPEVIQLLVSLIARSKDNQIKYYRQVIKDIADESDLKFIPIRSVAYGATNTVNRLAGARFNTGVVSALINPTEKVENIENILRQ